MRTYRIHSAQDLHKTVLDLLDHELMIFQYRTLDFCRRLVGFYREILPLGRKRVFEGSIWYGNRVKVIMQKKTVKENNNE